MKKAVLPFLASLIFFMLAACRGESRMDIWIFIDKFNDKNDSFVLELSSITSEQIGEGKKYDAFITSQDTKTKLLISFYSTEDGSIKKCIITACKANPGYPFDDFCSVAERLAAVLSSESPDFLSAVIENLDLPSYAEKTKIGSAFYDTLHFNYSCISNESGISFIIKNNLLSDETSEPPTLRKGN